jgi:hypothetical protein
MDGVEEVQDTEDLRAFADHVPVARLAPPQQAIAVEHERRPVGDVPVLVKDAVGADHGAMHVAQERERERVLPRERGVAEGAVRADGEEGYAAGAELIGDLDQAGELRRSDPAKVVAVEDEHHGRLPTELAQRDVPSSRGREREVRRGLSPSDRHRPSPRHSRAIFRIRSLS